ncbi:hypothetical protein [Halonotius terrestris]|uniref:hypothetical protein n=1 Tax=Halonotius terrestris TaxID=2487750 RepID=UPI00163C7655|nr:hypothetical protein [Halonotius terrestris]
MVDASTIEGLALPFVFGMAFGLAVGRTLLGNALLGVIIGLAFFGLFAVIRNRIVS